MRSSIAPFAGVFDQLRAYGECKGLGRSVKEGCLRQGDRVRPNGLFCDGERGACGTLYDLDPNRKGVLDLLDMGDDDDSLEIVLDGLNGLS
jgi:hypothetical protein